MGLVPGILFSLNKIEEHFLFSRKGKSMWAAHSSWNLLIPLDSISEPWGKKLILCWCTKGWKGAMEGPGGFIGIKGGVQLHPPEDERAPFIEKSHLRELLATAAGPSNLPVEIPWDMTSLKVWWGGVAVRPCQGRGQVCHRSLAAGPCHITADGA